MRFLLELVTCCGASSSRQPTETAVEESRSLVALPEIRRRRRKGRSAVVSRLGRPVAEWRPSLTSISEDIAPPEKSGGVSGSSEIHRKIRKVAAAAGYSRRPSQYCDETGLHGSSTMIPTLLSPTPFMF